MPLPASLDQPSDTSRSSHRSIPPLVPLSIVSGSAAYFVEYNHTHFFETTEVKSALALSLLVVLDPSFGWEPSGSKTIFYETLLDTCQNLRPDALFPTGRLIPIQLINRVLIFLSFKNGWHPKFEIFRHYC